MTPDLPVWTEFNPGTPPPLAGGSSVGRVVALVAGPDALDAGWVPYVALELAGTWGERFVLVDAGLEAPSLHLAADLPSDEGLSDLLLWGASVQRVMRVLPGGGFVVTAGTPIARGASAFEEPRWATLCDGFRQAGVTFVVLVPSSESGRDAVVGASDDVVLLAAREENAARLVGSGTEKVRATVGRVTPEEAEPAEAAPELAPLEIADLAPDEVDDFAPRDIADLAPDEVDDLAPIDVGELAPLDIADLAPVDVGDLAPDEVDDLAPLDIADLAPDEVDDFAPLDIEDLAPDEVDDFAPLDIADLAPDEVDDFAPLDIADLAPDEVDDLAPLDIADLAPAPDQGSPGSIAKPSVEPSAEPSVKASVPRGGRRRAIVLVIVLLILAVVAVAAYLGLS